MTGKLKLRAESAEDLVILASALQDAILRVGEIHYSARDHHIDLRLSRFANEDKEPSSRILCGLRVDGVLNLQSRAIDRSDPEAMMVLLSIEFEPEDTPPGGSLKFIFSGGGEIRAQIEAVDVIMADVSEPRATDKRPLHPLES